MILENFLMFLRDLIQFLGAWAVFFKDYALWIFFRIQNSIYQTFGTANLLVILWNIFLLLLAELVYIIQAFWAIIVIVMLTIGWKILLMFVLLFLYDTTVQYYRKRVGLDPVANPYALTAVDRGIAFSAGIFTLSENFMIFQELARSYTITNYFNHHYFRGFVILFSAAPPTTMLIAFLAFSQVVRRLGPDTRWFGGYPSDIWVKYVVRYHWCYALCQHSVINLWLYCFLKFAVANGLRGDGQEVWAAAFFFFNIGLSVYQMLCAVFAIKCPFPVFHRACIFNCGYQKGSNDDKKNIFGKKKK